MPELSRRDKAAIMRDAICMGMCYEDILRDIVLMYDEEVKQVVCLQTADNFIVLAWIATDENLESAYDDILFPHDGIRMTSKDKSLLQNSANLYQKGKLSYAPVPNEGEIVYDMYWDCGSY